jgi:hypothetical protein
MLSGSTLSPALIFKKKTLQPSALFKFQQQQQQSTQLLKNGKRSKTASGSCCLRLKSKTQTVKPR